ncbi:MAG: aminotransferase class V-fold PLP-dependent enzyme [Candidatus Dormibacteraceae bacterium]
MSETLAIDVEAVRAELPATQRLAYLNTGTAGPLPTRTAEAMRRAADAELSDGRIGMSGFFAFFDQLDQLRAALAAQFGARPSEIGLTHNTTEGMNIGAWSLDLRPGERVVTTTLEHGGGLLPLYQLHRRRGIEVHFVPCGNGEREIVLEGMRQAIRPGVRLVVLSHVSYQTGAVLPIREVAEMAHEVGALVVVDGAQSAGAIPLDLHGLGVDVYAIPGQKWLCGPEGTGAVFVREARLPEVEATFVGGFGVDHHSFRADRVGFVPAEGSRRYEIGSVYRPSMIGLHTSLTWLQGLGPIPKAIGDLVSYCLGRLTEVPGAEVLTPRQPEMSGLVAVRLPGADVERCVEWLSERRVAIRSIADNGALRISCGFFNTRAEIDRTVALLQEFQRQ